ncbi:Leishmanolysin-like peptidase [Trichoplax sp. H2]|nr:Leishmanolysin-like peptidase [Trichoplax sp. H2]|eukprot:RDD40197.1 Leishmanolysin-like peptidase [Trichoplax sp. H2]
MGLVWHQLLLIALVMTYSDFLKLASTEVPQPQLKSSTEKLPIRIALEFVTDYMDLSSGDMENLKTNLIPNAVNQIQNTVRVNPVRGNLTFSPCITVYTKGINRGKCARVQLPYVCGPTGSDFNISDSYLSETVCKDAQREDSCVRYPDGEGLLNTDLLLYIFVLEADECRQQISPRAFSNICAQSSEGRPTAAYVNFCPQTLSKPYSNQSVQNLIIHELIHILAFSKSLLAQFRRDDGTKYNAMQTFLENGSNMTKITSPKVLAAARSYFNCSTLNGIQLENQNASNYHLPDALAYWEMRILRGELMTGAIAYDSTSSSSTVLSNITLALLEDSGWYSVNDGIASVLTWGKGLGCAFASGSCANLNVFPYLCDAGKKSCSINYQSMTQCVRPMFMDNCPIFTSVPAQYCNSSISSAGTCKSTFGTSSKCLEGYLGDPSDPATVNQYASYCVEMDCFMDNRTRALAIRIAKPEVKWCLKSGQIIRFSNCNGNLTCPSIQDFCSKTIIKEVGISTSECSTDCQSCLEANNENACTSCKNNLYVNGSIAGSCIPSSQCPSNAYADKNTRKCIDCHPDCLRCSGNSWSSCTLCGGNTYLIKNVASGQPACVKACPIGTINFQDGINRTCADCPRTCYECEEIENCKTCNSNAFMYKQQCYVTCPSGLYGKIDTKTCEDCNTSKCIGCINNENYCTFCIAGYTVQDGECLRSCPLGRQAISGVCVDRGIINSLYQVTFDTDIANLTNSELAVMASSFNASLGIEGSLVGEMIPISTGPDHQLTVYRFTLIGSYSVVRSAAETIRGRLSRNEVVIERNGMMIPAENDSLLLVRTLLVFNSSILPTQSTDWMNDVVNGLKVWQWIAIFTISSTLILLIIVGSVMVCVDRRYKGMNGGANTTKVTGDENNLYYSNLTLKTIVESEHNREKEEAVRYNYRQETQFSNENNPYVTIQKTGGGGRRDQPERQQIGRKQTWTVDDRSSNANNHRQRNSQQQQQQEQNVAGYARSKQQQQQPQQQQQLPPEDYVILDMSEDSSPVSTASPRQKYTIYNDQYSKKSKKAVGSKKSKSQHRGHPEYNGGHHNANYDYDDHPYI